MKATGYIPNAKEQQFDKYREKLISVVMWRARRHFELWKRLQACREDYLAELNTAPTFFGATIEAHLYTALMCLFKILDRNQRGDVISIWTFLNLVETNLDLFSRQAFLRRLGDGPNDEPMLWRLEKRPPVTSEEVARDKAQLEELPLDKLKTWRNKFYAHLDKELALADIDVHHEYPVVLGEVEAVINAAFEIVNKYSLTFDGKGYATDVPGLYVEEVLKAIRFYNERRYNT